MKNKTQGQSPCRPRRRPGSTCRVLVVDDHPLAREALTERIRREPGLACCAAVGSITETLPALTRSRADLVLLDLSLADGDAVRLIREIRRKHPAVRIVALSMTAAGLSCGRAVQAGADACVSKEQSSAQIMAMLKGVWRNDRLGTGCQAPTTTAVDRLSDRQVRILRLIGRGHSSREIAAALEISTKTVDTHRQRLRMKLGLPDPAALRQYAIAWAANNRQE